MFTRIVWSQQIDPNIVYKWIYQYIRGNAVKNDLDFKDVVLNTFGFQRLVDLIGMIKENQVTTINAKQVMMAIIDGDQRLPSVIADELGFRGGAVADEAIVVQVGIVIDQNPLIVEKIIKKNRTGPIMALVGQVMSATNRRGDPVLIKHLIVERIEKIKEEKNNE